MSGRLLKRIHLVVESMRKYQPLWKELVRNKHASVLAPKESHIRIIQAVRKERSKDDVFNLLNAEAGISYQLHVTNNNTSIQFKLTIRPINNILIRNMKGEITL